MLQCILITCTVCKRDLSGREGVAVSRSTRAAVAGTGHRGSTRQRYHGRADTSCVITLPELRVITLPLTPC